MRIVAPTCVFARAPAARGHTPTHCMTGAPAHMWYISYDIICYKLYTVRFFFMQHNMRYWIIHQTIIIKLNRRCVVQAGDVAAAGVGGEERRSSLIQQVSNHFMDCRCVKFPNHFMACRLAGGWRRCCGRRRRRGGAGWRRRTAGPGCCASCAAASTTRARCRLFFVLLCDSRKCCYWLFLLYIYIHIYSHYEGYYY